MWTLTLIFQLLRIAQLNFMLYRDVSLIGFKMTVSQVFND